MKNFVKYIFIIFVIGIMGFAIYQLNVQKDKPNEDTNSSKKDDEIIKEITIGIAEYDTINPILSNNKYVQEISKIIYEPLLDIDKDYKIKNCLAKEWAKTSPTTYLIRIEPNIKWSNGNTISVEDVIYTINTIKQVQSIYSSNVSHIVDVSKIDETTIQITLDQEISFFEYNLIFPIMSKSHYDGKEFNSIEPIGTGKYKIARNETDGITLNKNENYNREELTLETINIVKYNNIGELYNAFKLGLIDILTTDNINIHDGIGNIGYNIVETAGRKFDFLAINTQNDELSDPEVRRAICYAINKENIVVSLYNNKYRITNYPLDYGNYLKGGEQTYSYNPDLAKQQLTENGWEYKYNRWQKTENYHTKNINFKLIVQSSNNARVAIAEMIKANLNDIGIQVSIVKASDTQYQNYLQNKNYEMILTGITEQLSPNLERFFGEGNLANYNNEEVRSIMNEVRNITKEEVLIEKYTRLRQIYNEEMPYIGLYNSYYAIASNWNLRGNITANWYNIYMDINNWYKN